MSQKKVITLDRLRQVAANAFSEHRFECVSVAQIAAESRCSSTTIYEIFGSKEGLLIEAASYTGAVSPPPTLRPSKDGSLLSLLDYVNDHLEFLAQPETFGFMRAGFSEVEEYRAYLVKAMTGQQQRIACVIDEVQRLMDAGLLHRSDARATAYTVYAGTTFDLIAQQILNGSEGHIDNVEVIRLVFTPLVTRKGGKQLNEFVQLHRDRPREGSASCVTLYDLL